MVSDSLCAEAGRVPSQCTGAAKGHPNDDVVISQFNLKNLPAPSQVGHIFAYTVP